jgi:hypothetical protein
MKNWSIVETPYPRNVIRLLEILNPEKVARLIDAAELPFYGPLPMDLSGLESADPLETKDVRGVLFSPGCSRIVPAALATVRAAQRFEEVRTSTISIYEHTHSIG